MSQDKSSALSSRGDFTSANEELPTVGQRVILMCSGYRCLGYLDARGIWRDDAKNQELNGVVGWQKLSESLTTVSLIIQLKQQEILKTKSVNGIEDKNMNTNLDKQDPVSANGASSPDGRHGEPGGNLKEAPRPETPPVDEKATVPAASNQTKNRRRIFLVAALLIVGVAVGAYYFWFLAPYQSTDDATIEGHVTAVAPQISGRVTQVLVQDNEEVKEGAVLLEIDPRDYETKLLQAQANLTAAHSELAQAKAQLSVEQAKVTQERANLTAAQAQASYAQADWKRYQNIGNLGVSQSQIDLADTQAHSSDAQVEVARSKILAAEAQATLSQASIETASANIQQNESAVRQAELNLSYAKVTAPENGRVTRRMVEKGAFAQTGQALLTIVPHQIWVVANFKETQLENMRVGQPVEIKVDAYPHHKFTGHVDSFQTGSGARFSLFPPENATGNYIKVLQRVPVKIVFDESSLGDSTLILGPGMSAEPEVRVK
jgi:membrane fusion protein, multidrug efflux system